MDYYPTSFDWMSGFDKALFLRHFVSLYVKLCMKCHLEDILVYADYIRLIARPVTGLQRMILVTETYLNWLDLSINCAKLFVLLAYR
jgi:hypothetical protein